MCDGSSEFIDLLKIKMVIESAKLFVAMPIKPMQYILFHPYV